MGLFDFAKKTTVTEAKIDKDFFYPIGGDGVSVFGENTPLQNLRFFERIPEVGVVLNRRAEMTAKMILEVRDKKSGEPLPDTHPLQQLIKNPNWWQSQTELIIQEELFNSIHGNSYTHFLTPVGFGKGSIKQMSSLNPIFLKANNFKQTTPSFLMTNAPDGKGWIYTYNNTEYSIAYNDILHSNSNNVSNDLDYGASPLQGIKPNLENIISAYEARGKNLRSHGAIGILSSANKDALGGAAPFRKNEKEDLQRAFQRYGTLMNQWDTIITNLDLKWQKMGGSIADLMVFEEIEQDFQMICDKYGMQRQMFAMAKEPTFNNKKEAEKQTYTNTIIPKAQEKVDGLNKYFETAKTSYVITASFKHLSIFDEDRKERASSILLTTNALSKAYIDGAVSLDEYQKELNGFGIGDSNE